MVHLGSGVGEASADDAIDMTTQQYSASVCRWRSLFLTAAGVGLKGHWQARSAAPSVLGPAALRDLLRNSQTFADKAWHRRLLGGGRPVGFVLGRCGGAWQFQPPDSAATRSHGQW